MTLPLLPTRKTLVGYARRIGAARSLVQLQILREHYRRHLAGETEQLEVLDLLCRWVELAKWPTAGSPAALPSSEISDARAWQELSTLLRQRLQLRGHS